MTTYHHGYNDARAHAIESIVAELRHDVDEANRRANTYRRQAMALRKQCRRLRARSAERLIEGE